MQTPTAGEAAATPAATPKKSKWAAWAVGGAFGFFLIKGLCWLIIPAIAAWWATRN